MADFESSDLQCLSDLGEELTCSICLCPFQCPVTTPCGHNFCQDCLDKSWADQLYNCPQCRTHFTTRPDLRKNTVLNTVVETYITRSSMMYGAPLRKQKTALEVSTATADTSTVMCDSCVEREAVNTCLTCMASFCAEHVRPHLDNPTYRAHQLKAPLGDLAERMCPDHHKAMEFFCVQHSRTICSTCLQQVHKGCRFSTPEEQKGLKESDLKSKLVTLDSKIEKTETALSQIAETLDKLKVSASSKKKMLEAEYQQIRDLLANEECVAMNMVDRQLQSEETKLNKTTKRFSQNIQQMDSAKQDICSFLSQSDTLSFLQASVDLPSVVNVDSYPPRVTLDSKNVSGVERFAGDLKDYLGDLFKQPVETRSATLKPGAVPMVQNLLQGHDQYFGGGLFQGPRPPYQGPRPPYQGPRPPYQGQRPPFQGRGQPFPLDSRMHRGQGPSPAPGIFQAPGLFPGHKSHQPQANTQKPKGRSRMKAGRSMENLLLDTNLSKPENKSTKNPETSGILPSITSPVNREDLLKYGRVLTLNLNTAHRRLKLSEDLTEASVMDTPANYPDIPTRFSVCSQVLTTTGFSKGRHYFEVKMSSSNYVGIGLAQSTIDRKGPSSRLGRNDQSWCVEWFTLKLSAWHANVEAVLEGVDTKHIGVLVDCDGGTATFYAVADMANPFHTFVFPLGEKVYPAFWLFSNTSSIALCKLSG